MEDTVLPSDAEYDIEYKKYALKTPQTSKLKEYKVKYDKKYHQEHKEKRNKQRWENYLKELYSMTTEQYMELVEAQNGVCAICGKVNKIGRELYVDHCHKTKQVRGLLCGKCNTLLGFAKDNIAILEAAKQYLLASREQAKNIKRKLKQL